MEKGWSKLAGEFDALQSYVTGEVVNEQIKSELSQLNDLGVLLELGCGNGRYTKSLIDESTSILATDISEDMLRVAKYQLKEYSNVVLRQADCYDTGLESEAFDTIFMANLIHVVAEPERAIKEANRLLKPNGRLVLVSFTADGMSFWSKIKLGFRYIKAFGSSGKDGTKFGLLSLKDFVLQHNYNIKEAKLLGDKQCKAVFFCRSKRGILVLLSG